MAGEGRAAEAARAVLEYLIIHLQYQREDEQEDFCKVQGTVAVSIDIEDSFEHVNQSHCTTVVSAKGDFCYKLLSEQMHRDLGRLLSFCQSRTQHESGCPDESPHTTPFRFSFELCENIRTLKEDCSAIGHFIHRISLVHPMINFHYCVKMNGSFTAETYSSERNSGTCLPDGAKPRIDGSRFMRSASSETISSCDRIHSTAGESVGLLVPDGVAESGFSGELGLTPVAALWPCRKSFPNQPVRMAGVSQHIFLYDPAGLPVLFSTKGTTCSFFDDPSSLAAWERYSYQATLDSDSSWEEDTAKPDVRYRLHTSHNQEPNTQEQTLLLFLFLTYSNQFQDKPVYNFWDRRVILSHLCPILLCSEQVVKGAIQGLLNGIVEQHSKVAQEQQKLAHSLPIMAEALSSIISSSTDNEFRRKCLQGLRVADTQELQVTLKKAINKAILKQWKPSSACDNRRPVPKSDEAGQPNADLASSSGAQKPLCTYSLAGPEQGGSCRGKGLLCDRSSSGRINKTKKRRPPNEELHWGFSEDPDTSGEAHTEEESEPGPMEPGTSRSSFPCPETRHAAVLHKRQQRPAALSVSQDGDVWQDDDCWNREVSNLTKWPS